MADTTQQVADGFCSEQARLPRSLGWEPGKRQAVDQGPLQGVARLVRAIETEIIPRLVLARRDNEQYAQGISIVAPHNISDAHVNEMTTLILGDESEDAAAYIAAMLKAGVNVEEVYLGLLTPVARRLGEMWVADFIDFTQVTIGVGRLQMLLRRFSPEFMGELDESGCRQRILLLPAPGEQHFFGVTMVAEFFRRAGWEVWCDSSHAVQDVVALVSHQSFSIAGFSLSSLTRKEALAAQIHAVRRNSLNKSIGILVGGSAFVDDHDLAGLIGADAMATDGRQAVDRAEDILGLLGLKC
ncbi:methanogenic corrinoid protein MtbC1 [Dongia mobilis]|uniref:Methanogenic corrinoid protein MtbC1 n=1 Tax=Dongia mobilis TaxID=578943 RepID=A0A4R6WT53_9PROT|nr:cobalamin-dependent protein [Dongia mobilis]TDQ82949.1 methanogenic corrinoid protein MtbC1 [Dongia mobilis]